MNCGAGNPRDEGLCPYGGSRISLWVLGTLNGMLIVRDKTAILSKVAGSSDFRISRTIENFRNSVDTSFGG